MPVIASSPAIYHRTHDKDLNDTRRKYRRTIVDCTLGAGGHAHAILSRFGSAIDRYIGIDKDMDALRIARETLRQYSQVEYIHGDFRDIDRLLPCPNNEDSTSSSSGEDDDDASEIIKAGDIDFVLLDAGISSMQLSDPERGFSFQKDGPLDMRMNRSNDDILSSSSSSSSSSSLTAHTIINTYTEPQLCDILYHYGEERQARRLARGIHAYRKEQGTIDTTAQLAELILRIKGKGPAVSPSSAKGKNKKKLHPATLTFQALRLCVNGELDALNEAVPKLTNRLRPDGRIAVISFHSLEDRIVKTHFRNLMAHQGGVQLVDRKPKLPSAEEIKRNPRARSAKMRCAQRLPAGFIGARVSVNKYAVKKANRPA